MGKKNICLVTQYYHPALAYGGPPKAFFNLANAFTSLGHSVSVITTDVLNNKRYSGKKDNNIKRFKTVSNSLAYKYKFIYAPLVKKEGEKILQNANIVLFSEIRNFLNWQIYSIIRKLNVPYGVFPFGTAPYGEGIKVQLKVILDKFYSRQMMILAKSIFCQTEHEKEIVGQIFGKHDNLVILPLPVGLKSCMIRADKQELGFTKEDKLLIFVGRLHYLKGVDILIDSLAPLLNEDKKIKLLIVGRDDGVEYELQKKAEKYPQQIKFLGAKYGLDVFKLYQVSDCFVYSPRFFEETSLASLEALSCGLPVVTTKEADIPYLQKYQAGYIANNTPVFVTAVKKILSEGRHNYQDNAKRLIKEKFSSDYIAGNILKKFKL